MSKDGTVVPGAEAWSAQDGDVGVLVVHGFTGNPASLRPLAEALAGEGFAVELPRLPGHGTRWEDLQRTTWREWAGEAAAALDRLAGRTRAQVVVGLSAGGALALHLAAARPELAGLVLVNPFLFSTDPRLRLLPLLQRAVPSVPGVGDDIAKPGGDEKAYSRLPLRALASLRQLQGEARRALPGIRVPVLVLTSRQDHVVEPENSRVVLAGIGSADREHVWLERSYHVATLDHDADLVAERTAAFVRRVTAPACDPA